MSEPLVNAARAAGEAILPKLAEPIRYSPVLEASLKDLMRSVKAQGLEGLVAKRRDTEYEPACAPARGRRCGSTRGRNSSSAATPSPRTSMRWSSATTRTAS